VGIVEPVFMIVRNPQAVLHQLQSSAKMANVWQPSKAVKQQTK